MRAGCRMWQTMAVGGIGLSLYAGWLTVDDVRDRASSERDIAAACDHLVSGAQVMDLQGGMVRAESSGYDTYRLDARHLPSACTIYKVSGSHRTNELFRLIVKSSDDSEPVNMVGDKGSPFSTFDGYDPKDDVTAVADREPEAWPLGDGTLGSYTNFRTTIRAECGPGSGKAAPRLLNVTAVARYPNVSAQDHAARGPHRSLGHAAAHPTDRLPGPTTVPARPDDRGPLEAAPGILGHRLLPLGPWLVKEQGQGRLPDRALAIPARAANPVEGCLLAASPSRVRAIAGLDAEQRDFAEGGLTHSPWWLRTVSYFDAEAESVGYDEVGDDVILKPGTAGGKDGTWWASSICDGKPALHTISTDHIYDDILGHKTLNSLFRAYVDDITTRRGCTHITYPATKDFRDL